MNDKGLEDFIKEFENNINNMSDEEFESFCDKLGLVSEDNNTDNKSKNK